MLAAAGIENTAQIVDQASTLSPNTLTFFDLSERAAADPGNIADGGAIGPATDVTVVTDVVGGLEIKEWDSGTEKAHQFDK